MGFPISAVAGLSQDGAVYRAYGHLLAYRHGELLLAPVGLVTGDLRRVVDRCPIPWEEVCTVIDAPACAPTALAPEVFGRAVPALAAWSAVGWQVDYLGLGPAPRRLLKRYVHESGMRFARVPK